MDYKTLAQKLDNEIKCQNLKYMLFGTFDIDESDINKGTIGIINRLLTLGFVIAFIKWRNDRGHGFDSPNARRVFDAFKCIYDGENISIDLIIFVLTEMQLDVVTSSFGKMSYFRNIISGNQDASQIPPYRNLIKSWSQNSVHVEKDADELLKKLDGLCKTFSYLFDIEVELQPEYNGEEKLPVEKILIRFKSTGQNLDSNLILIKNNSGFYYLASYEDISDNSGHKSVLTYYSLDGVRSYKEVLPLNFFHKRTAIRKRNVDDDSRPAQIMAKSLFSISYRSIRNLSLSLSDTMTRPIKEKLYEHFSINTKYRDIFDIGHKKFDELNWDNIITILMMEEGPTELLEFVLGSDGAYSKWLLKNLEMRCNNDTKRPVNLVQDVETYYEREQAKEVARIKKIAIDNSSLGNNLDTINRSFMARGILNGLANIEQNQKERTTALFVESLTDRIANIDIIVDSHDSNESKVLKINKALEATFRHIIPFYYGIFAYQQKKEELFGGMDTLFDKDSKKDFFDKCEESFLEAARKRLIPPKNKNNKKNAENKVYEIGEEEEYKKPLCKMSLGELVGEFEELCKSVVDEKGKERTLKDNGKLLMNAIGRDYICDLNKFEELFSIIPDTTMVLDTADIPKNIVHFINKEKHLVSYNTMCANAALFDRFVVSVKQFFFFLIYNKDFEREMILGRQISYDPIYPYVVQYSTRSENRDGYDINNFMVLQSMKREVKILSEREYKIDEKYYCIPNEGTSTRRWWIDPFLISCRKYDDIIHDAMNVK